MTDLFSSFQNIQQRAEKAQQQQGPSIPLMHIYWSSKMGADKDRVIRLTHEGCIAVPFHEMVKTVQGKVTDAVCLSAPMIENHGKCPLCAQGYSVAERGMGLAVVREERIEGDGPQRRAIIRDKYVDLEDRNTGKNTKVLYIGTIKQAIGNFWNSLAPIALRYGNVTGRDLQVSRVGSGTNTTYSFLPLDVDPDLDSLSKVLARYGEAMDGATPQSLILQRLNQKSSEGYYKRNFGADVFVGIGGGPTYSGTTYNEPTQQQQLRAVDSHDDASGATFADLRNRLQSYGPADDNSQDDEIPF